MTKTSNYSPPVAYVERVRAMVEGESPDNKKVSPIGNQTVKFLRRVGGPEAWEEIKDELLRRTA